MSNEKEFIKSSQSLVKSILTVTFIVTPIIAMVSYDIESLSVKLVLLSTFVYFAFRR